MNVTIIAGTLATILVVYFGVIVLWQFALDKIKRYYKLTDKYEKPNP